MQAIKRFLINKLAPDYLDLQQSSKLSEYYKGFFPRFLDRQIVQNQLLQDIHTDGTLKEIAVMFTDLRGFTALSQRKSLRATNSLINNFYDIVIHHTQANGGIVDKFMGDGTMSIFGAYDADDKYVRSSVDAAMAIAADFKAMTSQKSQPEISLGVGINKGPALVGMFGNGEFLSFTALGHTVNLAARIQSQAKQNMVMISNSVSEYLPSDAVESMGRYKMKGMEKQIPLFRVVDVSYI